MRQNTEARSLMRTLNILRHVGQWQRGVTAASLHEELKIPRASLYRILSVLTREEFLYQDAETGRFRLGLRALNLGWYARLSSPLSNAAQPIMREVSRRTGQLCELVVAPGKWRVMALDVWQGAETPLFVSIRAGSITHITHRYCPGMIFLACNEDSKRLEQYIALAKTPEGRALRLGSVDDGIHEEVERCRRLQYIWMRQSGSPGVGRVSAPIYDPRSSRRRVLAVLGIACAGRILSAARGNGWGVLLREQARKLERNLASEELVIEPLDQR